MGSTESTLQPMEDSHNRNSSNGDDANRRAATRDAGDDPWWWEIEREDLVLDYATNATAASLSMGEETAESEGAAALSDDFNSLLKIGQHASETLTNTNSTIVTFTEKPVSDSTAENSNEAADVVAREQLDCDSDVADAADSSHSLDEFKEELRRKRAARQAALQDLRDEIATLRKRLAAEQMLTRRLQQSQNAAAAAGDEATAEASSLECARHEANGDYEVVSKSGVVEGEETTDEVDDDDANACTRSRHANIELANAQLALQLATAENLSLRTELGVTQKQVATLKEVVACCKQMLAMKEEQCSQLKTKLNEIEESFGEREMKVMSENLRQEYERQLGNIRQLRQLYEERQRIAAAEQENLQRLIAIKKDELGAEQERTKNFEERNQALMKEVETVNKELAALREECNEQKFEKKAFKEEMEAVNTLFSQMVMGFNGKNNLDIDRLAAMLEENRALLNDMATREASCSDGATLPKLLFELVEQAAVGSRSSSRSATPESSSWEENDEDEAVAVPVEADQGEEPTATASKIEVERLNDALDQTMQSVEQDEHGAEEEAKEAETNEPDAISSSGNDNTNSSNHNNNSNKKSLNHQHHRKSAANKTRTPHASVSAAPNLLRFHEPQIFGQVASTQEIIGNLPKVWKVLMELLSHHKIEQVQFEENGAGEDCYKSVQTPNGKKAELSVSKTYIKLKDLILEKKSLVKETNRLKTLNCHLDYRLNEQEKRLSAVSLELTKTWHLVGKMQRQHRQLHTQEQILRYQLQQKRRLLSELKDELEYCRRKWAAARAKNDESQEQCNDLRREFAKRKLEDANNSAESGYSDSGPPSDEEGGRSALPAEEAACCRSELRQMFEHSRKIKRMQSTSPGRANCVAHAAEVVLRWNSAPPTCGWRADSDDNDDDDDDDDEGDGDDDDAEMRGNAAVGTQGAIHKEAARFSRSKQRGSAELADDASEEVAEAAGTSALPSVSSATRGDHVVRIERLEEQCKSLIQQVLETSDSRERLEVQLCRLQDAIAPVQHALPLEEFISKKRLERMTRASSAPASAAGTLTPREEEYTRKRSERLGRLEEESRQLISRIKRTSDRGHYLRCSLERLHKSRNVGGDCSSAALSRESSFDSNTEEDGAVALPHTEAAPTDLCYTGNPLTEAEEAYTTRRDERLKRLEAESKQLLTKLGQNAHRGTVLAGQLDALHQQHGDEDAEEAAATTEQRIENIERSASSRSERLRVLEEEGKQLISRLSSTSERGTRMINRIAEREQSRAARIETAAKEAATRGAPPTSSEPSKTTASADDPLLPPLKNVACSSIVSEELAECVTVTTTASQIAHNVELQGAVPKSKPLAQLSVVASRNSKSHTKPKSPTTSSAPAADTESLEQMVKRLQSIPFPEAESAQKEGAVEQAAATQEPPKEKPSTQQQQLQQEQEKHT